MFGDNSFYYHVINLYVSAIVILLYFNINQLFYHSTGIYACKKTISISTSLIMILISRRMHIEP